jgi:Gram-negative bacterial TonB protein C-terminal
MKKILLTITTFLFTITLSIAQNKNSILAGTWHLKNVACDKYFTYDVDSKKFEFGSELTKLLNLMPSNEGKLIKDSMPKQIADNIEESFSVFGSDGKYANVNKSQLLEGDFEVQVVTKNEPTLVKLLSTTSDSKYYTYAKTSKKGKETLVLTIQEMPPGGLALVQMMLKGESEEDEMNKYKTTFKYTYEKATVAQNQEALVAIENQRLQRNKANALKESEELKSKKADLVADEIANGKVYTIAQKEPQFVGGAIAFEKHKDKILKYYDAHEYGGSKGTYEVTISFTVNTDGSVTKIVAENDTNFGFAKQAIKIFEKSPAWVPAEQDGKKVRFRLSKKITLVVHPDNWGE